MKELMNYCVREVRQRSFWVSVLAAGVTVYLVMSVARGEWQSLFLAVWFVPGGVGIVVSGALWGRYVDRKKSALREALENPPGRTYAAYTADGARLGNIPEPVYLEARYQHDIDVTSRVAQALNGVWVAWSVIVRAVMTLPVALVIAAFAAPHFTDPATLSQLTLGQILSTPGFLLLGNFCVIFVLMMVAFTAVVRGPSALPGYRDYRGVHFKRLLSERFPQVATADGFHVIVYKIDPSIGEVEVPA